MCPTHSLDATHSFSLADLRQRSLETVKRIGRERWPGRARGRARGLILPDLRTGSVGVLDDTRSGVLLRWAIDCRNLFD
jgi:hypothetical protein